MPPTLQYLNKKWGKIAEMGKRGENWQKCDIWEEKSTQLKYFTTQVLQYIHPE